MMMMNYMLLSFRKKNPRLWSTLASFCQTLLQVIPQLNTNFSTGSKPRHCLQEENHSLLNSALSQPATLLSSHMSSPYQATPVIITDNTLEYCSSQTHLQTHKPRPELLQLLGCNNIDQNSPREAKSLGPTGSRHPTQRACCSLPWEGLLQPHGKHMARVCGEKGGHSKREACRFNKTRGRGEKCCLGHCTPQQASWQGREGSRN